MPSFSCSSIVCCRWLGTAWGEDTGMSHARMSQETLTAVKNFLRGVLSFDSLRREQVPNCLIFHQLKPVLVVRGQPLDILQVIFHCYD